MIKLSEARNPARTNQEQKTARGLLEMIILPAVMLACRAFCLGSQTTCPLPRDLSVGNRG
jgi:hypothetical protein